MKKIPASIQTAFFTVLFVFLFLFAFTKLFGPIPFSVNSIQTTKTDLFTVSGEGEATAIPETAMISFGVTATGKTVEPAKDEMNQKMNTIVAQIKELGVEESNIKTMNFSMYPNRDFSGRDDISGYTVSQDVQVKVTPVDLANRVLDVATNNGANVVGGIQFVLDDDVRKDLEAKARLEAIKEAKEKAKSLADAAGIRLGRIISIQEGMVGQPGDPILMRASEDMAAVGQAAEPTQVNPGENAVRMSVSLSYETL